MDKDADLVRGCLEGDKDALREFVRAYEKMVYNLAYRMLGDQDDAKDAAQETFLRIFESLPAFRWECKLSTWVYRIASNECIARSKKRKRLGQREVEIAEQEIADWKPSALELVEKEETNRLVRSAIAQLPEKYRLVITLYYIQGFSYEEIAEILLLPVGTVKIRLFRAKKILKKKLRGVLR